MIAQNMVHKPKIYVYLMFLQQNVSFALFANLGMYMNFPFIAVTIYCKTLLRYSFSEFVGKLPKFFPSSLQNL